jgi:hypothetical protein
VRKSGKARQATAVNPETWKPESPQTAAPHVGNGAKLDFSGRALVQSFQVTICRIGDTLAGQILC